ncbi:hypothetical protein M422DRAFT_255257 [Sphaerobolus stellatus SS14]|uniref:Uncharacterized protein n=1 Tax=Sphaerobolus stellatus (strain SS14) TaxID=990650 RepID=A0A0C9V3Z0_SPHS4|nr:hypothetical protein M422DRAFT_255257 [Sphaerobolus stellatus SS14]
MALHIEECLMRFGPIRGWWAFPIERLIGAFQHTNTNWKFGELEETLMSSYGVGSNIRIMLNSNRYPPILAECKDALTKFLGQDAIATLTIEALHVDADTANDTFRFDTTGNLVAEVPWHKMTHLPRDVYHALLKVIPSSGSTMARPTQNAFLYSHITMHGRKLSTARAAYRDSLILYRQTANSIVVAGSIQTIFARPNGRSPEGTLLASHYIAIRPFKDQEIQLPDPYLQYPVFGSQLWSDELDSELHVISPRDVICQFAACRYAPGLMVIIPLRLI